MSIQRTLGAVTLSGAALAAVVVAYNVGAHIGQAEAEAEWEEYLWYDDEKECWCVEDIAACLTG